MNNSDFRVSAFAVGKALLKLVRSGSSPSEAIQQFFDEFVHDEWSGWGDFAELSLAWAQSGFPRVEPSHRLAASLMATSVPLDSDIAMPWSCFMVVIPDGLFLSSGSFALVDRGHTVSIDRPGEGVRIMSFGATVHTGAEPTLADWNKLRWNGNELGEAEFAAMASNEHLRETEMLGRLVVGVCAEMSMYNQSGERTSVRRGGRQARGERLKPETFKLTRDVKIDVRGAIADYIHGRSGSGPTVQTLVRGHWKRQPHGESRAQRKLIHIEPYWRGPEDAPGAVRAHRLE